MPSNFARVVTSLAIWTAAPLIVVSMQANVDGFMAVLLVGIVLACSAGATQAVWSAGQSQQETEDQKAKRHGATRVSKLMNSLSEDELDDLRARLMSRDESVPLNELLSRREEQQS